MGNGTRASCVTELVRQTLGDKAAEQFAENIERRRIVKELQARRAALGMTSGKVARKCRIRKETIDIMEMSFDGECNVEMLRRYAEAVGMKLKLTLVPRDTIG